MADARLNVCKKEREKTARARNFFFQPLQSKAKAKGGGGDAYGRPRGVRVVDTGERSRVEESY